MRRGGYGRRGNRRLGGTEEGGWMGGRDNGVRGGGWGRWMCGWGGRGERVRGGRRSRGGRGAGKGGGEWGGGVRDWVFPPGWGNVGSLRPRTWQNKLSGRKKGTGGAIVEKIGVLLDPE